MAASNLTDTHIDTYIKTAIDVANYFDDEERDQMLNELSSIVELNCKLKDKLKTISKKSAEIAHKYVDINSDKIDFDEAKKTFKDSVESYSPDVSAIPEYKEFINNVKPLYSGTKDKDADEFCMTVDVNVIDPFTKTRIQEPVKNICGHVYDLISVKDVLMQNPNTRCPAIGCKSTKPIQQSDLKVDLVTKAYLKKHPA